MQFTFAVVQITSTYASRPLAGVVNTSQSIAMSPRRSHCIDPELARPVESHTGGKNNFPARKRGSASRSQTDLPDLHYRAAFAHIRFHAVHELCRNRKHVFSRAE
jgi:hypothetical protein